MLKIFFIPAEIDAVLARGMPLNSMWDKQAAEFEEALAAYEAAFDVNVRLTDETQRPSSLHQPTSLGAEESTTSSRTSKCPRESEWCRLC